jgi:hypothetical protein
MVPFVFTGQACSAAGACVAATISAPAWIGLAVVGGAIIVGSKLIDANASDSDSDIKNSN